MYGTRPDAVHLSRRSVLGTGIALAASSVTRGTLARQATPGATPAPVDPAAIIAIAEDAMAEMSLRAALLTVRVDGAEVVTHAAGESMTGVPATLDMHLRNGAVAITYMSTLLLTLVDDGTVALDDTIYQWLPDLPDAGRVTLRMLANMTAGYPDYVPNPEFEAAQYRDPFRTWTPDELIAYSLSSPRLFAPGDNWDYSHTNYVILGLALEAATGRDVADLLRDRVLDPIGLSETGSEQTAWMPEPVLHAYTAERRESLGIPAGSPFIEESTYWDPSWTITHGAVQYSTVRDMAVSFEAIGSGALLSEASYRELVSDELLGFGAVLDGCRTCHPLDRAYLYGLGIVMSGSWVLQNPMFGGYGGTAAYHPGSGIAIAVATTFGEGAFDEQGSYRNASTDIFKRIAELVLPSEPPLIR